jgi:protein-disulfide isomerase
VIPDFIEQYVDTGKVRYVYREFPLTSIHPASQKASEAAVCAGQQDRYWEMNEKLFSTTEEWGAQEDPTGQFKGYAQEIGLDSTAFNDCLDSGEGAAVVQTDRMAGETFGVNATPYFFVNELPIRGGLPIEAFGRVIDYAAAGGSTLEILPSGEDPSVRGDRQTASAVAVAFVDYTNGESAEHARTVLPELMEQYVDSGELLYVIHPVADGDGSPSAQAAAAVECAGQQGKYWEMHDLLFEEQGTWTATDDPASDFSDYAASLDLGMDEFEECLDSDWASLRVLGSTALAAILGIGDAPAYLFNDGQMPRNLSTFDEFEATISSILGQ